jgi:4-amino-4-deoxy-L-arabinose transferase-like glycosyltransferase
VVLLAIISLAAAFRAYRLSGMLPILVDESIYLRWAEIIDHQHTWFISLLDGKQPLSYWLLTWMRRIGPADPLMGGRIISAIAGVLSTGMLFFLAYRLGGAALGAFAALLCALLPYGVLYEHIAYTDALVSFFAILTAWAALECFRAEEYRWAMTLLAGSCLALAALIKTTALQFAGFPVFVGLVHRRRKLRDLGLRLALMAGMVALPLALVWHARPQGPRFAEISPVLHRTDFFASPANFGAVAYNARINLGLMASYLVHYVTLPVLLAAAAGLFALVKQRQWTTLAVIAAGLVPLPFQMLLLKYFPSRYIFPHAWCLLLAASALVVLTGRAGLCIGVLLIVPLALRSWNLVNYPSFVLHETDANEFLGSGPYSGFGAREAAMFLRQESESGPFVVLTDPFWGPPADVMFVYLQGRNGVRVYEAWWLQASVGPYPILPVGVTPVWKSQYQRIEAAEVNFDDCPRVYYVTDTNYRVPTDVLAREPAARLVARFLKQNGKDSIDVYRLR